MSQKNLRKELHTMTMSNSCQGIKEESNTYTYNQCNSLYRLARERKLYQLTQKSYLTEFKPNTIKPQHNSRQRETCFLRECLQNT